ncbi:2Fe-2S iron-sulfur cluster-binding protein [Endozoicomonadaceae bacterium StTr2]
MIQEEMGMSGSDTETIPWVQYEGRQYPVKPGQSVLDALLEAKVRVPFSCRSGLCHACMMETTQGLAPTTAQSGLSATEIRQGAFLACQCHPRNNLAIRRPDRQQQTEAIVTEIKELSPTVKALTISPRNPLDYHPGQYLSVWQNKHECRDLSIVSLPEITNNITFHVERHISSSFSRWVHEELKPGDKLTVGNVRGSSHYYPGDTNAPLLFVGFDTGIGALYGAAQDAIRQKHRGHIEMLHVANAAIDLYLEREMKYIAGLTHNFQYHPITGIDRVEKAVSYLESYPQLQRADIFICGTEAHTRIVADWISRQQPSIDRVFCDPFHHKSDN